MNHTILTFEEIKNTIEPVARKNGLESVYLFGSYARGEADEGSDVDILFTMKDKVPGLIMICDIRINLSNVLGKDVDVFYVPNNDDSKYDPIRKDIRKIC